MSQAQEIRIAYPIETARLRLEPFQATDGDALYEMERDPEVKRYGGGVLTRPQTEKILQRFITSVHTTGYGPVAVKQRASNQIVGLCGFYATEVTGEVEIFYGFVKAAWGQGYATEACTALIQAWVTQTSITRIIAAVHPDNGRSMRVLEKVGLKFTHITTTDALYGVAHAYQLELDTRTPQTP